MSLFGESAASLSLVVTKRVRSHSMAYSNYSFVVICIVV